MHRGYVKLWRKSIDGGWLRDSELWALWCWLLIKASHKPLKILVGLREVHLNPGDMVFGRKGASKELEMSEQKIRTRIQFLESSKNITIKSTNKFSIISIVNWETYQQDDDGINQQVTNKQPTSNHKQECKTHKKNTYSRDFDQFYAAYPKKRDPDRAWKAWQNRNGNLPEISVLLDAIKNQIQSLEWKKENGRFIPYPATWLNAGSWKNEVDVDKSNSPFG
jgi:hypothetical protein